MTQEQRVAYWQQLIEAHSQSSLSVTDFCRQHQIPRQRFYLWRQRFKTESQVKGTGTFLELIPSRPGQSSTSKSRESGIRLRIHPSLSIELDCGFDPLTLRQVIDALGGKGPCLP